MLDLLIVSVLTVQKSFIHSDQMIVVSNQPHEDLDFVETVVVNRGVRMRLFHSVVNAAAWLNE